MNIQNLRDDLYAYRKRIFHHSGFVLLPLGMALMALPVIIHPSIENAPLAACLIVAGCVIIACGITLISNPLMMKNQIRYRYDVELLCDTEKLRSFLASSGMVWTSKTYPDPRVHSWPTIQTRIFVTRLEDRVLLRMKF